MPENANNARGDTSISYVGIAGISPGIAGILLALLAFSWR
jgi:hypothetical protein